MKTKRHNPHELAQDLVPLLAPLLLGAPTTAELHLLQDGINARLHAILDMARLSMPAFAQRSYRLTLPYFYREAEFLLTLLASDYGLSVLLRSALLSEGLSEAITTLLRLYRWAGHLDATRYTYLAGSLADRIDTAGRALEQLNTLHRN